MTGGVREPARLSGRTPLRPGLGTTLPVDSPALHRLVGDVDDFARDKWSRATSVARKVHSFWELVDIPQVLGLVADTGMRLPDVRMMKRGEPIEAHLFTRSSQLGRTVTEGLVDADAVASLISGGGTLILQGLRRYCSPVDSFCRRLDVELGQITQAGAFLTPPHSVGAPNHYDYFDAFVCQVEGRKHWSHGAPPNRVPTSAWQHGAEPLDDTRHEVVLDPGDCLYLPRGTFHQARTKTGPSLHLTLRVVQPYTFRTLLESMLDALSEDDLDRALPIGHSDLAGEELLDMLQKVVPGVGSVAASKRLLDALEGTRNAVMADFESDNRRAESGLRDLMLAVNQGTRETVGPDEQP